MFSIGMLARAEGNCPAGFYPIGAASGQGGPQGCAPIPGYGNSQSTQQQASPRQAPLKWASQWGALATDAATGSLGTIIGADTRGDAEQQAIEDCQSKGGSHCKVSVSYSNGCAAMVIGDKEYNSNSAATVDEAVKIGMKNCTNSGNANCHVYFSTCSMPVRIQ